jgi:ergothioneine biosynthesis protein EgtB
MRETLVQVEIDGDQLDDRQVVNRRLASIRQATERLVEPLAAEDQVVQTMADASPTKWHQAHTSWFFETFLLKPFASGYEDFSPAYGYLFNSYYQAAGPQFDRLQRGLLSRPTVAEIAEYRAHVEDHMHRLILSADPLAWRKIAPLVEIGCQHEQQHQELILSDIKHVLSYNPLEPAAYPRRVRPLRDAAAAVKWHTYVGGVIPVGHDGPGFAFDHEEPRHDELVEPYKIASRPVTNAEFREFIDDGGYSEPRHWLSDGWAAVLSEGWTAPLYWRQRDDEWRTFTLSGPQPIEDDAPVCHVSFYEAEAYARWAGRRLPSEAEWEIAAAGAPVEGNFADSGHFEPILAPLGGGLQQLYGDVWEWTRTPYGPYPGYRVPAGAVGEYNGKFMINQMVLRGGSCATPAGHIRPTYRNFFPPDARWQFSGLRLADNP